MNRSMRNTRCGCAVSGITISPCPHDCKYDEAADSTGSYYEAITAIRESGGDIPPTSTYFRNPREGAEE